MSFDKTFSQLTAEDIESLVQNKVSEDKNLEFKQKIPDSKDEKAKIKICQCISSFANTNGGILIFGIKQNSEGEAIVILNIDKSLDEFSLQLQNMVRDRISPKMQPLNIKEILVENKRVILVQIMPSYTKPHFVNNDYVFYGSHAKAPGAEFVRCTYKKLYHLQRTNTLSLYFTVKPDASGETPRRIFASQ